MAFLDETGLARFFSGIKDIFAPKTIASQSNDGLMSTEDKVKLNAVNKVTILWGGTSSSACTVNTVMNNLSDRASKYTFFAFYINGTGCTIPCTRNGSNIKGSITFLTENNDTGVIDTSKAVTLILSARFNSGTNTITPTIIRRISHAYGSSHLAIENTNYSIKTVYGIA